MTETFIATIYVGLREGYTEKLADAQLGIAWLQSYCDLGGCAVSVTHTTFIYKNGTEPGLIIGLINYPRFPSTPEEIKEKALEIAKELMRQFKQHRVSIVCSDETIMIENDKQ